MLVALAGGIGASKFLRGLTRVWDPKDILIVVNTGDDLRMHGLHVSPDIDSVVYRLAGVGDDDRGWGRGEETWNVLRTLTSLGEPGWYGLGDRDIAGQLLRTRLIRDEGWTLTQATSELCKRLGVQANVVPMSNNIVETRVEVAGHDGPEELSFQEYWVARRAADPVLAVRFRGIENALPAPGILESIGSACGIVFCPSNPIVSISPILSVGGVRKAIEAAPCPKLAVTPIIAGAPVRGMADKLMPVWGIEVSALGVARMYARLIDYFVLDGVDAAQKDDVRAFGLEPVLTSTLMSTREPEISLARTVVSKLSSKMP